MLLKCGKHIGMSFEGFFSYFRFLGGAFELDTIPFAFVGCATHVVVHLPSTYLGRACG